MRPAPVVMHSPFFVSISVAKKAAGGPRCGESSRIAGLQFRRRPLRPVSRTGIWRIGQRLRKPARSTAGLHPRRRATWFPPEKTLDGPSCASSRPSISLSLYRRRSRAPVKCAGGHHPDAQTYESDERRRAWKRSSCPTSCERDHRPPVPACQYEAGGLGRG